jgi:hypothetical protein
MDGEVRLMAGEGSQATASPSGDMKGPDFFGPLLTDIRSRRLPQDQQWLLYHSAWRGKNTRSFFRSDMFNHFIPAGRKSVEKYVTRAAQMLVPSPEFFEVYPGDEIDSAAGKRAESVRAFHTFLWSKKIKPYPFIRQLLRSYAIYSRAIAKSYVRVVQDGDETQVWPHARAVDPFSFYAWPETVTDLDDGQVVFEDVMMPWETYQQNVKLKISDQIEQRDLTKPEWPTSWTQRLALQGMVEPSGTQTSRTNQDGIESDAPVVRFVALTDCWVHMGDHWRQYWLVNNVPDAPRIVRTNKRKFSRHPYRMAAARDLPGEHYTTGLMDDLEPLQVLLNDQVNMTLEGQATLFSPPTAINPDLVSRQSSIVFRPRAKWLVNPEGVKFMEPQDTTKAGYAGISFTMGLMDNYSGMGPLADGTPTRNMPRSGMAVSSLLQMSLSDITDGARMIEDMVLSPMLGDLHKLTLEFVPMTQVIKVPGTKDFPPRKINVTQMDGEWEFRWVGSLQSQDYQVRAQRLVATLGMIAKMYPIVSEDLMRRGHRINIEALIKRVWRDGLGERGADSIIEDIPPQELAQIQMERMMQAVAEGEAKAAKEQGRRNAAKPPRSERRGGNLGGGGNTSNPDSGEAMDRNQSRGMATTLPGA